MAPIFGLIFLIAGSTSTQIAPSIFMKAAIISNCVENNRTSENTNHITGFGRSGSLLSSRCWESNATQSQQTQDQLYTSFLSKNSTFYKAGLRPADQYTGWYDLKPSLAESLKLNGVDGWAAQPKGQFRPVFANGNLKRNKVAI